MSVKIDKQTLSNSDISEIKKDCTVAKAASDYGPANKIFAVGETQNSLYIPFAYAKKRFNESPNKAIEFPGSVFDFYQSEFPFRTDGGRDQKAVFEEALAILKKHRSVLLSLFCGYGKTYTGIRLAQTRPN